MAVYTCTQAQSFAFRHLSTTEGLLSDLRLVMTEDRQGRLWIASDEGINIFDGYQLSSYSQPNSLATKTNSVQQIFCDSRGTIWIATPDGILFKNENDNLFRSLEPAMSSCKDGVVFGETSDSSLIIVIRNNCYLLKPLKPLSLVPSLIY